MSRSLQLLGMGGSPFVRKVLMTAYETELKPGVELVVTSASPIAVNDKLNAVNPLGKMPALVLKEGDTAPKIFFDSGVIVQYLDSLSGEKKVLPPVGSIARYEAMTIEALADGIVDAAILVRVETLLRPEEHRLLSFLEGQRGKIQRGVVELAKATLPDPAAPGPFPLTGIAATCALWYLNRRFPTLGWESWEGGDRLKVWFDAACQRENWKKLPAPLD